MGPAPLPSTARRRAARLTAYGAAFALLVLLGIPVCPFAAITRHPCPGCGLTRASLALLRGQIGEAVRLHPLAPVVTPVLAGWVLYAGVVYVREGRWPGAQGSSGRWVAAVGIVLWTLLLGVWLARFQGHFGGPVPV
jgi:hypothetical protein